MQTTQQLVELAKAGQRDAIGLLVQRYERLAVTTAWSIVGDFHWAQDVAQESFVTAFQQMAQLRSGATFGSWLLVSVRRNALRHKQRQREVTTEFPMNELVEISNGWIDQFEELLPLLNELPSQEYEVVSYRYLNGFSIRQISEETQRPIGTITKQLSRAVHRMREIVAELER